MSEGTEAKVLDLIGLMIIVHSVGMARLMTIIIVADMPHANSADTNVSVQKRSSLQEETQWPIR